MSYYKNHKKGKFGRRPEGNINKGPREYRHFNQLSEADVGITQFINSFGGFSGIIKARFSDFHVNEINLSGEIAKLTDLDVPKDFMETSNTMEEPNVETPTPFIPQDKWDSLRDLLTGTSELSVELNVNNFTKDERGKIHECIQHQFAGKIYANTVTKDEVKFMVCEKSNGKKNSKDQRIKWPQHLGEYVHFLVYKEAVDTLEASLKIASCLRMSSSNLSFAGVKDKRAKTTQWFCIRKVNPKHLVEKTKPLYRIKIGNITFKDAPLKIGQLSGNQFKIALRNVVGDDELIEKSLISLRDRGFINYYGLQRFGNDKEVPTHAVGIQLLLGNWQKACNLILKPLASDNPAFDVTKAKKIYAATKNVHQALRAFGGHKNSCIEHLLLTGLSKEQGNNYVNALAKIPRNTRLLYIHAFQSLIWNKIASKRIEKFGMSVVEGDLILLDKEDKCTDDFVEVEEDEGKEIKCRTQARALDKDECEKYTIYDIVLPLPGYDIIYPEHLRDDYKEALEEHGLTLEMTKQKVQTYTLSGTYRKLMGKVENLSWKITHYNDPNDNLIRSDYEELKGDAEPQALTSGTYKALILQFSLASSIYATMALREIMKTETSSSSHAKLNNYHLPQQTTVEKREVRVEDEEETFDDEVGLLKDKEKYEQFKRIVFGESSSGEKRKLESDDENENTKISKIE